MRCPICGTNAEHPMSHMISHMPGVKPKTPKPKT